MSNRLFHRILGLLAVGAMVGCTEPSPDFGATTLLAAGDIGDCGGRPDLTARIIEARPGTVLTLGDHAYSEGSADEFAECFARTWGRFKDRIRPVPGNHDYRQPNGAAYFEYFGAA